MKNWKTSLIGCVGAAITAISIYQNNGGNLSDWKLYLFPVLLAIWGVVQKDAGVTGKDK